MNNNDFDEVTTPTKTEQIGNWFRNIFTENAVSKALRRKVLLRKTVIFYAMLIPLVLLVIGGVTAPTRVTYTKDQLATEHKFENGTGEITLATQTYSKDNGIMVLEFETSDSTSSIQKGINANNLKWNIYTPPSVDASEVIMDVIPLTDNKVTVVVRNVPSNYGTLVLRVENDTASDDEVDVTIKDYDEYKANSAKATTSSSSTSDSDVLKYVDFYVTAQSGNLKYKKVENLSREKFALKIFNEDLTFQKEQITRLNDAITKLQSSITEDTATLEQLQREAQYLVGSELDKKQDDIDDVQDGINNKEKKIATAKDNIITVKSIVDNLKKNIKAVKDGSYQFNAPVQSIKKDVGQ